MIGSVFEIQERKYIMIQTKSFRKTMEKKGLWKAVEPLIEQASNADIPEKIFVELLDRTFSLKDRLAVMEELGCCKTHQEKHKAFYNKYADKTLKERVSLMDELDSPYKAPIRLNEDHTLSVFWAYGEENHFDCVCSCQVIRDIKKSGSSSVSSTYCACCGGHVKALLQTALGVNLRLKEVISSALNSNGKKGCEFLFDVIE